MSCCIWTCAHLFRKKDYVPIDFIRPKIWNDTSVEYWYSQNTILYCDINYMRNNSILKDLYKKTEDNILSIVHPRQLKASIWLFGTKFPRDVYLSQVLKALPELTLEAISKRLPDKQ